MSKEILTRERYQAIVDQGNVWGPDIVATIEALAEALRAYDDSESGWCPPGVSDLMDTLEGKGWLDD